jgi:hypothetical protein
LAQEENIERLGEAIGAELGVEGAEKDEVPFCADILGGSPRRFVMRAYVVSVNRGLTDMKLNVYSVVELFQRARI